MSDFDDDEAPIHKLFESLRKGWRTRVDFVARVRERLGIFEERFAAPEPDRWVGRTLLSFINAASQVFGLDDDDKSDDPRG